MAMQQTVLRQLVDCGFLSPIKPHIFEGLQDVIDLDVATQDYIAELLSELCIFDISRIGNTNQSVVYSRLLDVLNFPMIVDKASTELPGNTFYTLSIDHATFITFSSSKMQFDRTIQKIMYSGGSAPVITKAVKIGRKQVYTALFVSFLNFPIFTKN